MTEVVPMSQWWHLEYSIRLAKETLSHPYSPYKLREELICPGATYFVALVHGGVKGFAGYKKTGISETVFEFPWCVVTKEYQGKGLGRLLTEHRLAEVKAKGAQAVLLATPHPKIYQRYGFRMVAVLEKDWAPYLMLKAPLS